MSIKLLTEHHLEFLSLKGGCTGSSKSILVKMSHCWKSHVAAHLYMYIHIRRIAATLKVYDHLDPAFVAQHGIYLFKV